MEENIDLDSLKIESKSNSQQRSIPGPNTQTQSLNPPKSSSGANGNSNITSSKPITPSQNRNLDSPLEGSFQGSVQVDNESKKDTHFWNGTIIEAITANFHLQPRNNTLLHSLQNLFVTISTQKKQVGVIGPKQFITKLKESNGTLYIVAQISHL